MHTCPLTSVGCDENGESLRCESFKQEPVPKIDENPEGKSFPVKIPLTGSFFIYGSLYKWNIKPSKNIEIQMRLVSYRPVMSDPSVDPIP